MIDPELEAWIAKAAGGPVLAAAGLDRWRPTWFVEVWTPRGARRLVLKGSRAPQLVLDRSAMLRRFGVDREAEVLAALQDTGIAVPGFVAADLDRHVLLMERVPGSGILANTPPGAGRDRIMQQYGAALAGLHRLTWQSLPLQTQMGIDSPLPPHLPGPLAAVAQDWAHVRAQLSQPEPLLESALLWLEANVPRHLERVLLHGDAGVNQFLYERGDLRAVIDWELSYIGDPMSDLGYARFREALYPSGSYPALIDGYRTSGGRPVIDSSVSWHTVVACLVMLLGIARDVHRPRAAHPESVQRLWWDALSRLALCQALGEAQGRPAPLPAAGVDTDPDSPIGRTAALLAERLSRTGADGAGANARRVRTDVALAGAVRNLASSPPGDDYLSAAARLGLNSRATGWPREDLRAVSAIVERDGLRRLDDLLDLFTADALQLFTALLPLAVSDSWDDDQVTRPDGLGRAGPVLPALSR